MKYLIVKGWLGFGDRLESLKMAIAYAKNFGLQIYVDWRDEMWSHGEENFYTYFKLNNIPVLNSIDDIPEDASVYPEFWKGKLKDSITPEIVSKGVELKIDLGLLDKPFDADVIVYSSVGRRYLYDNSSMFADIIRVVDPRIIAKVNERRSKYPVERSWGIHIRGTDRLRPNKRLISIQSLVSHVTTMGALNGPNMTVVSDDKEHAEIWKRYYPQSFLASELSLKQDSLAGNHNLNKDKLRYTKDQMNVDMLADFFTLALTQRIFTTCKDSRFTQEARRLHPIVNKILGQ